MRFVLTGTNPRGLDYEWSTEDMNVIKEKIKHLYGKGVREFKINGSPVTQEMIDYVI